MSAEQQQLEAGIRALEAQRGLLGDAIVDAMLAPARAKLAALFADALAPSEPAQTLRQLSILFLDIVGSTQLAQLLDPEAVSAVLDGALSRGTAIVEAHRGRVLQYAGDNILAAFGADEVREDDAERAVHCGLALLALGKTLGEEVHATHGRAGINVRVGIHTGGVLLGGGVDVDGSIRGSAVNIAARMEQTAPAGTLRISHDAYAQVRGMFEVETQPPLAVKGVDAPVQSYLVLRAKPRNFRIGTRGIEGVATRMIGRDAEFELLQSAFKRLWAEGRLATVTVVADAGIGKSRLLYEFAAWSEARPESFFLFRGRATPQTGTQAFGLLRDILAWRFQIADDDNVEAAQRKLEDGIVPLFIQADGADLAEGHAHLLGHLIGLEWKSSRHIKGILDDPKQIRNRAFHAAAQIFRRVSASDGSPVILQLEDLHWADGESLDFLNYLSEVNRDVPLLMLAFTRPTLFERRTDWGSLDGTHQRIDLQPLDRRASRELAAELLNKLPEIPAALKELLTGSAEGNPFFMEELVKMLIDQGAIRTGETWSVNAERLLVTKVPPTLTGVLQSRLDGLPAPEKRALQQASIVGAVFWDQALAAIDVQAAEHLPALVQRELALPRADAQIVGLREYAFRHQILHQVTYDTVLKRHKGAGHARVAQWLAGLADHGGLRSGDVLGLAAQHFEQASDPAQAAEFHARAAEQAGQRLAHERVLAHVGRALALLSDAQAAPAAQVELRWRLLTVREQTLSMQARHDEGAADIDALTEMAGQLNDDRRRAEAAKRRGQQARRTTDWAEMERAAHHGMACAIRAGDNGLRLNALRLLSDAKRFQGDVEAGVALAQRGLAEARILGLRGVEALMLRSLLGAVGMQDDLPRALDLARQSLQISRELGDRVNEAACLSNVGYLLMKHGDLPNARRELDEALLLLSANGDRDLMPHVVSSLSLVALWQGAETQALALARQALDTAVAAKAPFDEMIADLRLGGAELALGRMQDARQAFAQAHTRALEVGSPAHLDAAAGLARVALAEADTALALAELQPVMDHIAAGGTFIRTGFPRLIEFTCHRTLSRAGDPRAAEWLKRAYTEVMAQAEAITDLALRQGFLQNIPHHREIAVAWAKRDSPGDSPAISAG